jgi:hypothetical protein
MVVEAIVAYLQWLFSVIRSVLTLVVGCVIHGSRRGTRAQSSVVSDVWRQCASQLNTVQSRIDLNHALQRATASLLVGQTGLFNVVMWRSYAESLPLRSA